MKRDFLIFIAIVIILFLLFGKSLSNIIKKYGDFRIDNSIFPEIEPLSIDLIKPDFKSKNKKWVGDLLCCNKAVDFRSPKPSITRYIERISSPLYRPPVVSEIKLANMPKQRWGSSLVQ